MRLLLILVLATLVGCNSDQNKRTQKLSDTLEKLSKKVDYLPLEKTEAYRFINEYYLPRLDTMPTKRKIYLHPLNGFDFKLRFQRIKEQLKDRLGPDSVYAKAHKVYIYQPESLRENKDYTWDGDLLKAKLVTDTIRQRDIQQWRKKFGYGYMCISYPQYNSNTKRLVIREWLEDNSRCGTGREHEFWYTKTATGWEADDRVVLN